MEEREWMRDRALEMDSHHECMGSSAVDAAPAEVPVGFGVTVMDDVEEDDDDEGELATWLRRKSIGEMAEGLGFCSIGFSRRESFFQSLFPAGIQSFGKEEF